MTTGAELRDAGVDAVLAADKAAHRADAEQAITHELEMIMARGLPFTSDDVHDKISDELLGHHPNVMPAVFSRAREAGQIVPVGYTSSRRPSRHAAAIRVWLPASKTEDAA